MSGELAQLIALVAYGNQFLASGKAPDLLGANSTFRFVSTVEFVSCDGSRARRCYDPSSWYESLTHGGVRRLALDVRPRSSELSVVAESDRATTRWTGRWSLVGNPRGADERIWGVLYECTRSRMRRNRNVDLERATVELRAALERASEFAHANSDQLSLFAEWFEEATQLLEAEDPVPPFHPDVLPASAYDLPARRLVAAATRAWVFGGMGSWNDVWLESPRTRREYRRVSNILFKALLSAFAAGANSSRSSTRGAA